MWVYRFLLTLPANRPTWQRIAVMLVALACSFAARHFLADLLLPRAPFGGLLPAVLVIAWFSGAGFGLLATALSAVYALYFFVSPEENILFDDPSYIAATSMFCANGVFVSLVCGALHVAVRQASAASREAGRQFEIMANNAPVLMWIADAAGRGVFFNKSWLEFTGRTRTQHEGIGWFDDIHPDDRARCMRSYEEHLITQRSFKMEFRLRRANDEYRWVLNHAVPRHSPDGEFEGYIGSCTDITDSRLEREELGLLAELQAAFAASLELEDCVEAVVRIIVPPVGDWCAIDLVAEDGKLERVRARQAPTRTGEPVEITPLIPPDAQFGPMHIVRSGEPRFIERLADAVWGDGTDHQGDFARLSRAGVNSYLGLPLRVRGRIIGVLSIATLGEARSFNARDIAFARKVAGIAAFALDNARLHQKTRQALFAEECARRALEVSERRFRSIWDSNVIGVCIARRNGQIMSANDAFLYLLSQDRNEFIADRVDWRQHTPAAWVEQDERMWRQLLKTGRCGPFEKEYERADGQRLQTLLGAAMLPDTDECVIYGLDLTPLKTAQRALQRQQELLNTMIDAVPAMIAYLDQEGCYRVHNRVYQEWFGRRAEEINGLGVRDLLPEETGAVVLPHFRAALEGNSVHFEFPLKHPQGEQRQMLATFTPDHGANGAVRGVVLHAFDITDRKRTEAELARSEERYRTLVTNTSAIVWTMDAFGRAIEQVKGWETFTGQASPEYLGRGWRTVVHPEDLPTVGAAWREARRTKGMLNVEFRLKMRGGAYRHVRGRGAPVLNEDGSVREWIGTVVDIHDRKEAEHALRRQEAQLQLIIDAVPALIAYVGRDLRYQLVNRSYERWFGLAQEQIRKRRVQDVIGEMAFTKIEAELKEVLSGRELHYERFMPYSRGGPRWVEMNLTPHLDEKHEVVGYVGLIHDISARKRIEQELADALGRYRFLADAVPQIVWTATPAGEFDYFNRRWFEYTGLTPETCFPSRGWLEGIHPDDRERTLVHWQEALRTCSVFDIEHRLHRASDGAYRWHLCRGMPRRDESGAVVQWVGTSTDLDEQKQAFTELTKAREELRHHAETLEERVRQRTASLVEANSELEAFSYSVSHDLRTPLQFIQGFSEALLDDQGNQLTKESRDYLHRIIRAASRMDSIIHDLLSYSRLSRDEMQLQSVGIEEVVRDVLQHHQAAIQRSGVEWIVASPLPTVRAHPVGLFQVLTNLVSNALKFTANNRKPQVRIGAEEAPDGRVRLYVEDNGIGIDPKHHQRIFKMFERLHSADAYPGTGIGLTIVRKAVERMGGAISVESRLGEGSRFCVDLAPGE